MNKILLMISIIFISCGSFAQNRQIMEPVPPSVTGVVDGAPPSDAIVLFDGSDLDAWQRTEDDQAARWLIEDGAITVRRGVGTIKTKRRFGDIMICFRTIRDRYDRFHGVFEPVSDRAR